MTQIKSVEELKTLALNKNIDCFIRLNFGLNSSKHIEYSPKRKVFFVLNHIDETFQTIPESKITDSQITLIGEAIEKGALWLRK
jgi:hypothetical protein